MSSEERIGRAILGGVPDRVPSIPKIWVDLAAKLTGTDLRAVIEDPLLALRVIAEAGLEVGADGARQFHFPARSTVVEDGVVFEVDRKGNRLGRVDMEGGLRTYLFDVDDFDIEDPYDMAYNHYWTAEEAFVEDMGDVENIAVPDKGFYEEIGCGRRQREIMDFVDDRIALIGNLHSATLTFCEEMRGYERSLRDLVKNPQLVQGMMEKGAEIAIERGKFNLDLGIKILRLNDSIANMSAISPKHWRKFILPQLKNVCDALHDYDREAKIYCHICGNILPVAEDLLETGLDCIGPLDPLGGFSPGDVREVVGDRVSLYGGVNTLSFVNEGPEDIVEEARSCILQAGKSGGYILGSGCVIPREGLRENLEALKTAVDKYGVYSEGELQARGE